MKMFLGVVHVFAGRFADLEASGINLEMDLSIAGLRVSPWQRCDCTRAPELRTQAVARPVCASLGANFAEFDDLVQSALLLGAADISSKRIYWMRVQGARGRLPTHLPPRNGSFANNETMGSLGDLVLSPLT